MVVFVILLGVFWALQTTAGQANYYFATHNSYESSTLSVAATSSQPISGSLATVTQQCRRLCAQATDCKAYHVKLLIDELSLGSFVCNFYDLNACNWGAVSLQSISSTQFSRLWDKLDAIQFKAKSCADYCAVKYPGDCKSCRGFVGLKGIDCDIAPRLCSGYTSTSGWETLPIWPWGFYGRKLFAICYRNGTAILVNNELSDPMRQLYRLGWNNYEIVSNFSTFTNLVHQIDWELISELVSMSTEKKLVVFTRISDILAKTVFTGFELSPFGELSLNASLSSSASTGFPLPLSRAPFVFQPPGYNVSCGSFWQFESSVSVCQQRTNLLNFANLLWDGNRSSDSGSMTLAFL